ncbi:phosphonate C-P lyase system protein PhnH [Alkalihalobacterium sp. APHAB7]|uniref:phosphonate C-P lyase system protein PhnH n=1 Tax=Alkalihalobacterium sp. APHAB7 TaxID=3402081 RepID=UPI003AAE2980
MTKANLNTFDMVFETQAVYRILLDCMARPGKILNICSSTQLLSNQHDFPKVLEGIALTLVDQEVTFNILSHSSREIVQYLKWKTFGNEASIEKADFIFIQEKLEETEIIELMSQVKRGTLEDPHLSATIILLVQSISSDPAAPGIKMTLQGPGIAEKKVACVEGLSHSWLNERSNVNKEFPLGIDIILATETGDIMAIPRTTSIESEEDAWGM